MRAIILSSLLGQSYIKIDNLKVANRCSILSASCGISNIKFHLTLLRCRGSNVEGKWSNCGWTRSGKTIVGQFQENLCSALNSGAQFDNLNTVTTIRNCTEASASAIVVTKSRHLSIKVCKVCQLSVIYQDVRVGVCHRVQRQREAIAIRRQILNSCLKG